MHKNWERVLTTVCKCYFKLDLELNWLLVGSAGSCLQGCVMEPGDLDLYVEDQESVSQFADLLCEFSLSDEQLEESITEWYSTKEKPVLNQTFPSGFSWTKARWKIDGFDVEVVHISNSAGIPDSLTGDGMWEGGQYIWNHYKKVGFGEYTIPVVPLEIQLESNLRRGRQERVKAIIDRLKSHGYDKDLIKKALSSRNLAYFNSQVDL